MTLFDFQTWITFAVASEIFLIIPGPTILLVVAYSFSHGRTATLPLLIGVGLGDLTAMIFSFAGLGLLLNRISELFFFLKWAGALYLIYMGIQLWLIPSTSMELYEEKRSSLTHEGMFLHAWVTTALNPKSIVFFLAFLPQFLNQESDFMNQVLVLGSIFWILALVNTFGYAWLASKVSEGLKNPLLKRRLNRVGGSLLFGAGGISLLSEA